ncbi:MAG: hypothetical protein QGG74_02295 [Phycisphaerales bacterium]|nr:hypothetical protein [Phycisphaerales bacterium]
MSEAVHLVFGPEARDRPTLLAAIRRSAARRGERVVSLGAGLPGAAVTIPLPADRIGIASETLARWADGHMRQDEVFVAWDSTAVCVGSETQHPVAAVLDGEFRSDRITRCAALLIGSGSVPLMAGSAATAHRLCSDRPVMGSCGLLPAAEVSPKQGTQRLRIILAAEPHGQGAMFPMLGVLGRLRLLGAEAHVCISGSPDDATRICRSFAGIGIEDVVNSTARKAIGQVGDVVFLSVPLSVTGVVTPVAPAVMAWASGADIILPDSHPAVPLLGGRSGVLVMQDTNADECVRWVAGPHGKDVAGRIEVVRGWRSESDLLLDEFIAGLSRLHHS